MAAKDKGKVILDINAPTFIRGLVDAEAIDTNRVLAALLKAQGMDWDEFVKHPGFKWEKVAQVNAYSMRITKKYRALAYRDDDFLVLLTLHLDHDSAYK